MKYFLLLFFLLAAPAASAQLQMPTNANAEDLVRQVFADAPAMVEVARCESGIRQFTGSGSVLRGGAGGNYIGIFQLSSGHAASAKNLGMDIYTAEGNIAYARVLYDRQGTSPWATCVPRNIPASLTNTVANVSSAPILTTNSLALTTNLQFGMSHPEVKTLQQLLNAKGYAVSNSGAGSPGNESSYFGQLTREALKKFQCASGITCSGSESTTGFGRLGPKTRAALAAVNQ